MTTTRRALDAAARAVLSSRTEAVLRGAGAVDDRHVATVDGRHRWLQVDGLRAALDPTIAAELCGFWARLYRDAAGRPAVDAVVGSAGAGVLLAWETARQLGVRAGLVADGAGEMGDLPADPGPIGLVAGDRSLVVDAILDRPHLEATVAAVEGVAGEVVGCAVLVAGVAERPVVVSPRSGRRYELLALWRPDLGPFAAGPRTCPACAAGRPLDPRAAVPEGHPGATRGPREDDDGGGPGAS